LPTRRSSTLQGCLPLWLMQKILCNFRLSIKELIRNIRES
jgi:hypothetical protein